MKKTENKLRKEIDRQSDFRNDCMTEESKKNNIFIISSFLRLIQKFRRKRLDDKFCETFWRGKNVSKKKQKKTDLEEISEKVRKGINTEKEGETLERYVENIMKEVNE